MDFAQKYFGDRKKYKKFLEYNDIGNLNTIKAGDQLQVPVLANVATSAKQTEPEEVNQSSSLAKVEAKPTQKTTPPVVLESSMEASVNSSENILQEIREIRQALRNLDSSGSTAETLTETVEEVLSPADIRVFDVPNDAGKGLNTKGATSKFKKGNIVVTWTKSDSSAVIGYHIFRKQLDGEFERINCFLERFAIKTVLRNFVC